MNLEVLTAKPDTTMVSNETERSIEFEIPSDASAVDALVPQACDFLHRFGLREFSRLRLVLRELLINAVDHGNRNVREQIVTCEVELVDGHLARIAVEDQGNGFDHRNLILRIPEDAQQIRQRGYPLINAFSENIAFNDKGNRVTAVVRLQRQTTFATESSNGWNVVRPSADLTASAAERFRVLLLELIDGGNTRLRFDLTDVEDVDSVTLSVLFALTKTLFERTSEAELEIVNANELLRTLFRMTRLDRVYRIIT